MSADDSHLDRAPGADGARRSEARLDAVLRKMDQLHELSAAATRMEDLDRLPEMALDAAIFALDADFGHVQFYDPESETLRIVAHRGFDQAFLDYFARVKAGPGSGCARAMVEREPIAIQDVRADPCTPGLDAARRAAGYRSVLSAPMFTASGALLGMFTVHFRAPGAIGGEALRLSCLLAREIARAVDRTRAEITLRESEERLALALESARMGTFEWRSNGDQVSLSKMSEAVLGVFPGRRDVRLHPDDQARHEALFRDASSRGTDYHTVFRIIRPSDGQTAWIEERGRGFRDPATGETMIRGVHWDVTERERAVAEQKRAQDRQATLLYELQHRVRNILAMTRSLVRRTMASATSVKEAAQVLDGRIDALARIQALLTRSAGARVDLERLVRDELSAQGAVEAQTTVRGPTVLLAPKAAEVLTLAVHELATNAAKYGAIAQNGQLSVTWRITQDEDGPPWLQLNWSETGVQTPPGTEWKPGFGTELVEQRVPYELNGHGRLAPAPGGAVCEIAFPLVSRESILATDVSGDGPHQRAMALQKGARLDDLEVLILEDDYFFAGDASRALRAAGARVVGPFRGVAQALAAAEAHRPDCALLDINLGQGPDFAPARALRARGVPFVLVTGYDAEMIPRELADVPYLRKPPDERAMVDAVRRLCGRGPLAG